VLATAPAGVPVIDVARGCSSAQIPGDLARALLLQQHGGDWGVRLKSASYDLVFVQGRPTSPCTCSFTTAKPN